MIENLDVFSLAIKGYVPKFIYKI